MKGRESLDYQRIVIKPVAAEPAESLKMTSPVHSLVVSTNAGRSPVIGSEARIPTAPCKAFRALNPRTSETAGVLEAALPECLENIGNQNKLRHKRMGQPLGLPRQVPRDWPALNSCSPATAKRRCLRPCQYSPARPHRAGTRPFPVGGPLFPPRGCTPRGRRNVPQGTGAGRPKPRVRPWWA